MKEVLKQSVNFWQSYWGNSLMPWLLLAAGFLSCDLQKKEKKYKISVVLSFSGSGSVFLPACSQDHTEVYRLQCILACSLASSGGSCYCCGYDRISEGEKRHFAVSPGHSGGRSGSCVRKGHLSGRKL